jgi:putative tricarboxylic transport membrane protein
LVIPRLLAALVLLAAPLPRTPDGYPNRPIMIMAPANPGGGWDQTARVIQQVLLTQAITPEPVEVFNRGGAGGTIGLAELVSRHRRDPYVLMIGGSVMVGAIVTHRSPFSLTDAVPLARLINEYEVVAVPPDSPYQTLRALLDAFRRDPGSIAWGGGSAGGIDHMLVGLLAREMGVPPAAVRYVAFTGGGDAASAVMGGQVTAAVSGYGEWRGLADGGRVRLLGMSSPARIASDAPPSFSELGVNVVLSNWRGIVAAPEITPEARAWLIEALERMRETAEWQTYLKNSHWQDSFLAGAAFQEFLARDLESTAQVLDALQLGEAGAGYAALGPWVFPAIVLIGLAISVLAVARQSLPHSGAAPAARHGVGRPVIETAILLMAYLLAFERIGFVPATIAYLMLQPRILGSRNLRRDAIVAVALTLVAYGVFDRVLAVKLPPGQWLQLPR